MPHAVTRPNLYGPRPRPIGEMNVTPFIDVLLVLLIMVILATPMKADVTPVDLPSTATPRLPVLDSNTIAIDAGGRLSWNGSPVTAEELRAQVAAASARKAAPLLRFEPASQASYDIAARTIALIREEGAPAFTFVGNDKYADFD
jgi:biopolymer transport protein ExbD